MATLGTITWGMAAVLAEGCIRLAFWAMDERRRRWMEREIDTMLRVRHRLKQENDAVGVAVLGDMINDLRH